MVTIRQGMSVKLSTLFIIQAIHLLKCTSSTRLQFYRWSIVNGRKGVCCMYREEIIFTLKMGRCIHVCFCASIIKWICWRANLTSGRVDFIWSAKLLCFLVFCAVFKYCFGKAEDAAWFHNKQILNYESWPYLVVSCVKTSARTVCDFPHFFQILVSL